MTKSFKTFLKHAGKDYYNRTVNPPVVRASTLIFKSIEEIRKTQNKSIKDPVGGHFTYGREGSSTIFALQKILRTLEESYQVFLAPTGFGSVFLAIFSVVRPGDEILLSDPIYSPTRLLTENYLKEFNIKANFYNPSNINDLKSKISKRTKLIFVENPGSNTFEFQDLSKIISLAKKNKIFTAMDNTWGTPYFIKPIKLGFDMSIVAATKYYSGHSDVMGGSLAVNKKVFDSYKDGTQGRDQPNPSVDNSNFNASALVDPHFYGQSESKDYGMSGLNTGEGNITLSDGSTTMVSGDADYQAIAVKHAESFRDSGGHQTKQNGDGPNLVFIRPSQAGNRWN